ncbi:MAG: hypothetical protein Q9N32_02790 [Gammaproteobacteria bacterium]|nr:hypothetical protein [Gammaproteobacteria bacterium]
MKDSRPLETLAGIEYDSCCWRQLTVSCRDYIADVLDNDQWQPCARNIFHISVFL